MTHTGDVEGPQVPCTSDRRTAEWNRGSGADAAGQRGWHVRHGMNMTYLLTVGWFCRGSMWAHIHNIICHIPYTIHGMPRYYPSRFFNIHFRPPDGRPGFRPGSASTARSTHEAHPPLTYRSYSSDYDYDHTPTVTDHAWHC